MKALIGNAFLIGLAVAAASVAACSSGSSTSGHPSTASSTEDGTGSIGLQLTLPGGGVINTISYTVNGPNGAATIVTTGTVPVANSTSIFFQTPDNIAPGSGYTITLTGSDDAGDTCLGTSVPFTVTARTSTPVLVQLQCHGTANGAGNGQITAVTSNCATWQSVGPATSDIITGVADPVAFSATGPDHGNLAYTATVSGAGSAVLSPASGALTTGSANNGSLNVTCTSAGLVTVTLVFSDGPLPVGGSCDATLDTVSFPIQCEGQPIVIDSGIIDSSVPVDTGVDTGTIDTGVDTGVVDSGTNFNAICNTATGFTTGCSLTELAFAQHDPSGSCLACLVNAGAIDDAPSKFNDQGHECGDLAGGTTSPISGASAACVATLDCIESTNVGNDNSKPNDSSPTGPTCASAAGNNISDCFCGPGVSTATCAGFTTASQITGACALVEAQGLGFTAVVPPTPILNDFTIASLGSGQVNQIFVTASQNNCTSCF